MHSRLIYTHVYTHMHTHTHIHAHTLTDNMLTSVVYVKYLAICLQYTHTHTHSHTPACIPVLPHTYIQTYMHT
jgi:hypothetical protein